MKRKIFKFIKTLKFGVASAGFTMIELLIVIAILGILAVAVLSAINPVEQINRGRDTGSRSDAEQLLSAMDRYNAFQGYYPWVRSASDTDLGVDFTWVENTNWFDSDNGTATNCEVLSKLSSGNPAATVTCSGADELKTSFVERISKSSYNGLYVYNRGTAGDSTYVCFIPKSGAFKTEASDRCTAGLPADIATAVADGLCARNGGSLTDHNGNTITTAMICLP